MKSIIKSFGGKGTMINKIKPFFPKEDTYNTYIEPFSGAFSIGLTMDTPILIYNDLNKNIYSLFKVISDIELFKQFKEKCDLILYSEDLRKEFIELLKTELSILDRAFYFFYINRVSFNGHGGFGINLAIRRNMSKSVSDLLSVVDRLPELHNKLSKAIITNKNGIDLIVKYDRENVFIYADPPYTLDQRTPARYEVDMTMEQQSRLIDTLLEIKHAKVLLSSYENPLYKKLEENGWKRVDFVINTNSGNFQPKQKTESLYLNY